MDGISSGQTMEFKQPVKRPMAVWVFGVMNILLGSNSLVRMVPSWAKLIVDVYKATGNIIGIGILDWLLLAFNIGLAIWIIVLGYGLLTMKRWARRGSVLYGWIQVALIVIIIAATFIGLSRFTLLEGFWKSFLTIGNAIMLSQWIYMVLLIVFMKTEKVREAFQGLENPQMADKS